MYLRVPDRDGPIASHRDVPTQPADPLEALEPFGQDPVSAPECILAWYRLADLCQARCIRFVLGHPL